MQGAISTKHLFSCAHIIIEEYGFKAYLRCWWRVLTKRNTTFLECVCSIRKE